MMTNNLNHPSNDEEKLNQPSNDAERMNHPSNDDTQFEPSDKC